MARLDARWLNFSLRGKLWDHFWQDAATGTPPVIPVVVRRYYRGRVVHVAAVKLSERIYYVDE